MGGAVEREGLVVAGDAVVEHPVVGEDRYANPHAAGAERRLALAVEVRELVGRGLRPVAVDLDFKGLMVPVVHDADGKRLRAIAREISELAAKTRSKKLSPDEITGGSDDAMTGHDNRQRILAIGGADCADRLG